MFFVYYIRPGKKCLTMNNSLKLLLLAAVIGLFSCGKTDKPTKDVNWWYRSNIEYPGIKSIETYFYAEYLDGTVQKWQFNIQKYNRDGTLAYEKTDTFENTYTYNPDGTISKLETNYYQYDESSNTFKYEGNQTREYEYNNPGHLVIEASYPYMIACVNPCNLIPNLSKMVDYIDGEISLIRDYSFDEDRLTVTFTGKDANSAAPITVDYRGAYPYLCKTDRYEVGPITYQENGMPDSFHERVFTGDKITMDRTSYYLKGRTDKILLEKEEEADDFCRWFTYNEYGDPVEVKCLYPGSDQWEIYKIEYKYDSRGNWINKKETNKTPNLPQYDSWGYPINYNTPDTARDIEYY